MFIFATGSNEVEALSEKVSKISQVTDELIDKVIHFGINILIAIITFLIGKFLLGLVRKLVKRILEKSEVDSGVVKFVDSVVKVIGYILILITICSQIGIQTTSFITLLGTAGLSIGLALEGCLSNFAGGVLILVTKPFKEGHYIKVNDVEGTVTKMDIIYTTLNTIDNKVVKLPNGTVANSTLTNYTSEEKRRVDVEVGIHYEDDIKKAKEIATKVMNEYEYILKNEESVVIVKKLGESSIVLEVRMWTPTDKYWDGRFYLNEAIRNAFAENGIHTPYNQLDVTLHQAN